MEDKTAWITTAPGYTAQESAILHLLESFEVEGEVLHRKRNTVKKMQLNGTAVVVKSFKALSGFRAFIYGRFRKTKARRSFEYAQRLQAMGIATPDPVAFFEQHLRGFLGASFFVSKHYAHDFSMRYALPPSDGGPPPEDADAIVEAFIHFTFLLHEAGVLHIDHNPSNTLVRRQTEGWEFAIIDINRMRFGALNLHQRISNLVRLTDDEVAMRLIANTYAKLANEEPERCQELLMTLKRRHWRKLALKQKVKNLLGRGPR